MSRARNRRERCREALAARVTLPEASAPFSVNATAEARGAGAGIGSIG
jgi:hypothetical protein